MKKGIMLCIMSILLFKMCYIVNADSEKFELVNHCLETNITNKEYIIGREDIKNEILQGMSLNFIDSADKTLSHNELISPFGILDERGLTFLSNVEPATFSRINKIVACYDYNGNGIVDTEEKYPEATGFMVGPGIVLTAAHCIWNKREKIFPFEVRVYVKHNNLNLNSKYFTAYSWLMSPEYYKYGDTDYDWCILTM